MNAKAIGNIFKGDKIIWWIFFFLCAISITEVYSASSSLSYKSGNYLQPVIKHAGILIAGFLSMLWMLRVKCKYFKLVTPVVLIVSFLLLLVVLITGQATNGASRWLSIMGMQFQPSELAKGAVVLTVAQILSATQTPTGANTKACKYILGISTPFIILIGLENLSTAMLLSITIYLMMIVGRVPGKQLGRIAMVVTIFGTLLVGSVMIFGHDKQTTAKGNTLTEQADEGKEKAAPSVFDKVFHRADTWKARIDKWGRSEDLSPEEVDLDKDAQSAHANIAIASSKFIGKGPGNSVERDFLSQAFSDFIYAIVIEEMGLFGAFFVALLYISLLSRAGKIAAQCENTFPAFLAMGIAFLLVTQALFNMLVAVGIAPVTGQPLPLISRGGTSTIINCLYLGIILSISRTAKKTNGQKNKLNEGKLAVAGQTA